MRRFNFLRRNTGNDTIDWVTAMRAGSRVAMNCRRDIAMIRWALRGSAVLIAASMVYGWLAPKQFIPAHKRVPTYSFSTMVGE